MAFDSNNLVQSASILTSANKTASAATTATPKIFTATQATSAVQNYKKSLDKTSLNAIVANYQWVFNNISTAASNGDTSITVTTTNFDYNYIAPLFRSYGYIVSDLPSATSNPSDTTLKSDISISWPSQTLTPITGISPGSFIAIQNSQYSVTFVPQGGQGPYTFSLGGQLPLGWVYSSLKSVNSLTISGTSVDLGGGSLSLTVTDSVGQTLTSTINWNVAQPAQIYTDWNATSGLGQILNKPTGLYVGTTRLAFDRQSTAISLTGVDIDGNAGTVTDGVVVTGEYANPSWITSLAGSKITGTVASATTAGSATTAATATTAGSASSASVAGKLSSAVTINSVSFDGSANITVPTLVNGTQTLTLDSSGTVSGAGALNFANGAQINGSYGAHNNGILIRAATNGGSGPDDVRILCDYNGAFNQLTINKFGVGLGSATSNGDGTFTTPQTGITLTPSAMTIAGAVTFTGSATFIQTYGITKAQVGLGNVTNESKATMFTDSALTGTTTINQATLAVNGTSATSLVNKSYIDSKVFFALAVGIY